jgi:tRNA (mo5U34)-methyltransferase
MVEKEDGMRPVDVMRDKDLHYLNSSHPWITYCTDAKGRRVGNPKGQHYPIPHPLVLETDRRLGLAGKSVVEFGCLEGSHTIALSERAAKVIAIDARNENIKKARVRCRIFGVHPEFVLMDLETADPPAADIHYHSGVLYHLQDPVLHLCRLAKKATDLVLDTHHGRPPNAKEAVFQSAVDGKARRCFLYKEDIRGWKAGVRGFSRWLPLDDLMEILRSLYEHVDLSNDRLERNGPRATLFARGSKRLGR